MSTTAKPRLRSHVRYMSSFDVAPILRIERESFEHPWTCLDFAEIFGLGNVIGLVAESIADNGQRRLDGFMLYQIHRRHFQIIHIAVALDSRWQGVGRQLVGNLKGKINPDRPCIRTECSEWSGEAIGFWRGVGFLGSGVERDFYGAGTDAIAFVYRRRPWEK